MVRTIIRRGMRRPALVLGLAIAANLVDLAVTSFALDAGIANEVNPVAATLYRLGGVLGLAAGKAVALALLGIVLYAAQAYRRDRAVVLAVGALAAVAVAMPILATAAGLMSLVAVDGRI